LTDKLQFRLVNGEQEETSAWIDDAEVPAGEYLMARNVRLDGGTELRQHRPASGTHRLDGYERLDNEILAGRRLHKMADWTSYPPEVSRLHGDEAMSADPYALFEPYLGHPLREVGSYLIDDEFDAFVVSFLTGLCWTAAAGIAHRAISPDTVRWDSRRSKAQITDFSLSTTFGVPRTPVTGSTGWVPKEQRLHTSYGTVGPRDDIWAAGRLIFYVRSQGEDLLDRRQLADSGLEDLFNGLLDRALGPPENRPTAWELLEDGLHRRVYSPSFAEASSQLMAGRQHFLQVRQRRHPGAPEPPDFNADVNWMGHPAERPTSQ
jgi:serine/threonine protein kinase